ncbi:hypothetical protein [Candidatus Pantoea multigeneris]|uniref:Uncharacterized protein n=1 Tax=Candidatus Pantoea multigeneris TaxID=2608357 RepID=A0ABX0R625_9GAMM|nr:hypothetical protein [Pantoea multigeneris]NIF20224.1 hypothetical protein [Pantoea multigeneris]
MRLPLFISIMIFSAFSFSANLKKVGVIPGYVKNFITYNHDQSISQVSIQDDQVFDVVNNHESLGYLIPVTARFNDIRSVCYITWTLDGVNIKTIIPTVGLGDLETSQCDKVTAVGLIDKPDSGNIKLAVVYKAYSGAEAGSIPFILNVNEKSKILSVDTKNTEQVELTNISAIAEIKKKLADQ